MEIIEVDRHVVAATRSCTRLDSKTELDVWMLHKLTQKNMLERISICEAMAKRNEIDPLLKYMVTGDEKWVKHTTKLCENERGAAAQTVGLEME